MSTPLPPPSALGQALDAVDVHTASQTALAIALARGFFALTSEHASGAAATMRLSACLHDARPSVRASYVVERAGGRMRLVDTLREEEDEEKEGEGLRKRRGKKEAKVKKAVGPKPIRHSLHALPSARLREAAEAFESALVAAVEVANAERVAREKLERVTGEGMRTDA